MYVEGDEPTKLSEMSEEQIADLSEDQLAEAVTADLEEEAGGSITAPAEEQTQTPAPDNSEEPTEEVDDDEPGEAADTGATDDEAQDVVDEPGNALLQKARELGWDHQFESIDDFLAGVVNMRKFASTKAEHEDIGRLAAEAGLTPERLQRMAQPEQELPNSFKPPVEFDPSWPDKIKFNDETQELEGDPQAIKDYTAYERYKADWWARAGDDPRMVLRANEDYINDVIDRRLAGKTAKQQAEEFVAENAEVVRTEEFSQLLAEGMSPERAVELIEFRAGKSANPAPLADTPPAADPVADDVATARAKVTRRRQPNRRKTEDVDWSKLTEEQMAERAVAEAGLDIPVE